MPVTKMTGREILNGSIKKQDLNITDTGGAVVTQIIGGDNIDLDWTGPVTDEGTGVVTVNVTGLLFTEPAGAGPHPTVRKDSGHVIGTDCGYSGLLTGRINTLLDSANGSSIVGGSYNTVGSAYSSIVGGWSNEITTSSPYGSSFALIGGGQLNSLYDSNLSLIGGGALNQLYNAPSSVIAGGSGNAVVVQDGSILGGRGNIVAGSNSSVAGGYYCSITSSTFSFIGSGRYNEIDPLPPAPSNSFGFIGTGYHNDVQGRYSSVLNGKNCGVFGDYNTILGGNNVNTGAGKFNIVGIAKNSAITGEYSAVLSGQSNAAAGYTSHAVIVGGNTNAIFGGTSPSIINGYGNTITGGSYTTILNGRNNETESSDSTILSGEGNVIGKDCSHALVWGADNIISDDCGFSFVHGENVRTLNRGQKSWSTGKFSADWDSQVTEYMLRRVTGSLESDNVPLFLDWEGDRKVGAGGSGSLEINVPSEYGTHFVECRVSSMFIYTDPPGGPVPPNKHACFSRNFMVTWNGTIYLIDGSAVFSPGIQLNRQTGGDSELTCYFFVAGNTMRILVNHSGKFNSAFWVGYMRVTHLALRV